MTEVIYYSTTSRITPKALEVLKAARSLAYGDAEVDFIQVEPGPGTLHFGHIGLPDDHVRTLDPRDMGDTPHAAYIVAAAMARYRGTFEYKAPKPGRVLWMDTETRSLDERWRFIPEEYVRTFQYAWDEEDPQIITGYPEMLELVRQADLVVAHNGHSFDWSVLFGKDSLEALHLAFEGKLFDPFAAAAVLFPPPPTYSTRKGHRPANADSPDADVSKGWFALDNLAFQFGVPGKEGDLKALASEFGGFDRIPVDEPRFVAYALQDVVTLREVTSAMLQFLDLDDYDWREQKVWALLAQISRNGFRVDAEAARERRDTLAVVREELLTILNTQYGFPREGLAPWRTKAGIQAVKDFLTQAGINPEEDPEWPRSERTGAVSLSGKVIAKATAGTPFEEDGARLAELMGQRSMSQLTLDHLQPDGCVHPQILPLQRSGRMSVTEPGLTVFNDSEKFYYIAAPGNKLVSVDYSNADARAVAAMSGDEEYAKRFAPGVDSHELTGRAAFGDETYDSNPALYRDMSKPISHGSNYNIGEAKLAKTMKVPVERARELLANYNKTYQKVTEWKARVAAEGRTGWVRNAWGRAMSVVKSRAHTQSSGLVGQSTTREVICDALISIYEHNPEWVRFIKVPVHDELILEIPEAMLDEVLQELPALMETELNGVAFTVSTGSPANNWKEATHG